MPSTFTWVTAAPANDESSTRRRALPRVRPNPRSSGSTWKRPKSSEVWRAPTFATMVSDIETDKVWASSRTGGCTARARFVSAARRRAARPSGALARIELDDQLLVDGDFDLIPTGERHDSSTHARDVEREPRRHGLA